MQPRVGPELTDQALGMRECRATCSSRSLLPCRLVTRRQNAWDHVPRSQYRRWHTTRESAWRSSPQCAHVSTGDGVAGAWAHSGVDLTHVLSELAIRVEQQVRELPPDAVSGSRVRVHGNASTSHGVAGLAVTCGMLSETMGIESAVT